MINIIISLAAGTGVFFLGFYLGLHWAIGAVLGTLVAIGTFFLLAKLTMKKITALVELSSMELSKGQFERAIAILEKGFQYKYRHPFVTSQLNSQIGVTYYYKKDFKRAEEYLKKGMSSHYIGQGILGILYMKKRETENMRKAFNAATRTSGKESIIWSLYAYCLNSLGQREEAIRVLNKGLKRLPNDENIKANLLALQNKEKMKMRAYKDLWSVFMLEKTVVRQQPPRFARGGGGRKFYRR